MDAYNFFPFPKELCLFCKEYKYTIKSLYCERVAIKIHNSKVLLVSINKYVGKIKSKLNVEYKNHSQNLNKGNISMVGVIIWVENNFHMNHPLWINCIQENIKEDI
jgi:hypothetical protein